MSRLDSACGRASARRPARAPALARPASFIVSLAVALAALAACDKGPARECDSRFDCPAPFVCDEGSATCVDPAGGVFCSEDASCSGENPYCNTILSTCVGCIEGDLSKRCVDGRVCDKDMCKACVSDLACFGATTDESTLCLDTGRCAAAEQVAHVTAAGTDAADCSFAAPCSLAKALSTNLPYIRVREDLTLTAPAMISRDVTIEGSKELRTQITRSNAGEIFNVSGDVTVHLRNLQLADATGPGLLVPGGSPKLILDNVDVVRNSGAGIVSGTAALSVESSIIAGNRGGGITAGAAVSLENNLIVNNGSATSTFGGVQLTTNDATNVVRFNTFSGNAAQSAVGRSVACGGANVALSSNIFADAAPQVTMCTTKYSLFPTGAMLPGTGNKEGDPMFEASGPLPAKVNPDRNPFPHFHIKSGSPAEASGEPLGANVVSQDFDREGRGAEDKDIGADELN